MSAATPPPIPTPADPEAMAALVRVLGDCGFTEAGCGRRLGTDPLLGVQFHHVTMGPFGPLVRAAVGAEAPDWMSWSRSDDPLDVLIGLLLAGERASETRLASALGPAQVATLEACALITLSDGVAHSGVNLFPIRGLYLATDRPGLQPGINPVSALYPESYILTHFIDRAILSSRTLDLCTGCGVHALNASGHSGEVLGVDINPRAVAFAQFNRALNDLEASVEMLEGDLYEPCPEGARYDLIIANPPYVPSAQYPAGSNWFSGGPRGDSILSRLLAGLDDHLSPAGVAHFYAMLVHHPDVPYRDKMAAWLGDRSRWDVTIRAVPFAFRSTEPLDPASSHCELGLVSVQRCSPGATARYVHGPSRDLLRRIPCRGEPFPG